MKTCNGIDNKRSFLLRTELSMQILESKFQANYFNEISSAKT